MLGASGRLLVVLTLAAAGITAEDASARRVRQSCRDGVIAHRADRSGRATVSCDVDGRCDGVCSFEIPVCTASTCTSGTFTVPVRTTRREDIVVEPGAAPTKFVLRCRPTPRVVRCVTVTTTTSGPTTTGPAHLPGLTTTTRTGPVGPTSTSSTTTTTGASFTIGSSTTTSSTLPIPCLRDADCDGLATACAVSSCGANGICVQTCVCVTPELDRTCSLDDAATCLTPDDCPGRDIIACRVCYLNRCVTAPGPGCP